MIIPVADEIRAQQANDLAEQEAAQKLITQLPPPRSTKYRGQDPGTPALTIRLQQWAQLAPTLPAGALLAVAQAGIDAYGDTGTWLLNNAVPYTMYPKAPESATGNQGALAFMSDPARLEALKGMSLNAASGALDMYGRFSDIGAPDNTAPPSPTGGTSAPIGGMVAQGVQQQGQQVQAQGMADLSSAGDALKTGIREAGVVAQSGAEAAQMGVRQQAAGLAKSVANIAHGQSPTAGKTAGGVPMDPQEYQLPTVHLPGPADIPGINQIPGIEQSPYLHGQNIGGSPVTFGDSTALTDPGQITAVQQLRGKSVGSGFLPGGQAVADAQTAQRAAATVAGHALTPGRALASFVATPDSLSFKAVSGMVDGYVSLHFDPALLATNELTDAIKARNSIVPVTHDAITAVADRLIDKLGPDNANILRDWANPGDWATTHSGQTINRESVQHVLEGIDQTQAASRSAIDELKAGTPTYETAEQIRQHEQALVDTENQRSQILNAIPSQDFRQSIIDKIINDPVSLRQLADQGVLTSKELAATVIGHKAGLMSGLYDSVHPQNFLQFLVGPHGDQFFSKMAENGFSDIGRKTNWSLDAKLQQAFAEASTSDQARQAMVDHLSTLQGVPAFHDSPMVGNVTLGLHPLSEMRWNSILPTAQADVSDANSLVTRMRQDLQLFNIPRSEWDNFLPNAVKAEGDYTKAFDAFKQVGNRAADVMLNKIPGYQKLLTDQAQLSGAIKDLGDHIVPDEGYQLLKGRLDKINAAVEGHQDLARALTGYFYEKGNSSRLWHNAELGGANAVTGLAPTADGLTAVEGPFGVSELLHRGIPTPGGILENGGKVQLRQIQRAVSTFAPLFNTPVLGSVAGAGRKVLVDMIADNLTDLMRTFAIAHVGTGVRVLGSQAARMAAAGGGDFNSNRLGLIGLIAGSADTDMTGEKLIGNLGDTQNALAAAVGQATDWRQEFSGAQKHFSKGWSVFDKGQPGYIDQWANRLSHTSSDPIANAVAQALHAGEPLDAVKQSVWDGNLATTRQQMIKANVEWGEAPNNGFSRDLAKRSNSDAWVDAWAKMVQQESGNHPELLQAMADRTPFQTGDITDQFRNQLKRLAPEVGPRHVTGPIPFDVSNMPNPLKRSVAAMLSLVAGGPTRKLLTIPTAKAAYWTEAERLMPYLSEADAAAVKNMAAEYGIDLATPVKDALHTIDIKTADTIAKGYAAQQLQKIFYNPGRKSLLVDQLRDVIPFANVIGNTASTWAQLAATNPKVLRVLQMGVTDANQSGWWNKDQYGQTQMTIIPGDAMGSLTGAAFGMTGLADRLNIATQGWPGVGPTISWSAPALLSHLGASPIVNAIHNFTNPYGDPDFAGGTMETLAPGWFTKLRTSGWFAKWPVVGAFMQPSQREQLILSHVAMQVFRQKMSTGHYDMSNQDAMHQLFQDSMYAAQKLFLWRGLAQFALPVAPQFDPTQTLKDGSVIQQYLVAKDYKTMLDANKGDEYKATLQFVNKYGAENIFDVQPFTRPLKYGLPTTAESEAWAQQNSRFTSHYSNVYGYFAPQKGGFDYNTYLQQIQDGTREALTGDKWRALAEARIGNAIYDQARKALPPNLNQAQQAVVDGFKLKLAAEYPGFNQDALKIPKDTSPQTIAEFRGAIADPLVKDTPLAHAIRQYFTIRDAILAKQQDLGLSGKAISTSPQASALRNILYKAGQLIESGTPEFSNVWQHVFSYEVQNQNTQNATPTP